MQPTQKAARLISDDRPDASRGPIGAAAVPTRRLVRASAAYPAVGADNPVAKQA